MRRSLAFMVCAAALAAGCSTTEQTPPAPSVQVSEDYMLIRPPDEVAVVHIMKAVTYMPDGDDRLPVSQLNGASEAERAATLALFKALIDQPSPEAKAEFLAHASVVRDAPMDDWQQVRLFRSEEKCETTRGELQQVTKAHSTRIGAKEGMLLHDLQFHLLAASFDLSRCVPVSLLPKITES
jgi:hypothetical protein